MNTYEIEYKELQPNKKYKINIYKNYKLIHDEVIYDSYNWIKEYHIQSLKELLKQLDDKIAYIRIKQLF